MSSTNPSRFLAKARARAGSFMIRKGLTGLMHGLKGHVEAASLMRGLEVERDIEYLPTGRVQHRLDVYRRRDAAQNQPALLYIHGGGFVMMSKESHWMMAAKFAQAGYTVFTTNYRLAPKYPFPSGLEDVCQAARWVKSKGGSYGADTSRFLVAGESAGANLTLALCVAASYRRSEPFARELFEANLDIKAAMPACGILQVTKPERFRIRKPSIPVYAEDRIKRVSELYLGSHRDENSLADPLCILESAASPDRPLPPMFATCGTRDPLLEDTRRLGRSLERLGTDHEIGIYPGGLHGFHALYFRERAKKCWNDHFEFLRERELL